MKVLIMGCGRVGSSVAVRLEQEGHHVTVLDLDEGSFRRLPASFKGHRLVGSGTNHSDLEAAGIEGTEAFLALSQGDNRNILASQIVKHLYGVPRVVTRLYDPFRGEIFGRLGLRTFSPTVVGADLAYRALMEAPQPAIGDDTDAAVSALGQ